MPALTGRTALITGASSGIGRATAHVLAQAGCGIIALARRGDVLAALCDELRGRHGVEAIAVVQDVSDVPALQLALRGVLAGRAIDIAVVNAGVGQYGPVAESPWDDIAHVLRTNIDGAIATAHAVLPQMLARGGGAIVFITSVLGKRAIQWNAAYCASKFALQGFADALRLETAPRGVRVSVVGPARTETEFFARMRYSVPQRRRRAVPSSAPDVVARAVLRAVLRGRREIMVTAAGKLYAYAGHHFPRISDFILSRSVPPHE